MLAELLSAAGDDLSYQQDRIAAEATLATATQRRSVIRHARLVDYEPGPAASARVLLQVDVSTATVPSGVVVLAPQPDSRRWPSSSVTACSIRAPASSGQHRCWSTLAGTAGTTPYPRPPTGWCPTCGTTRRRA